MGAGGASSRCLPGGGPDEGHALRDWFQCDDRAPRRQGAGDLAPAGANIQRQPTGCWKQLAKEGRPARIGNDPVQPRLVAAVALIDRIAPRAAGGDLGHQCPLVIRRSVSESSVTGPCKMAAGI